VNFVSEVLEGFPSSKPALLAIDANGERHVWHFGELIAMSAGVSGAFATRGVKRGDVVMTLAGNRLEWVLSMLACWRMGAVALPCNTQLRRGDLEHRVRVANPVLCVGEEDLLGSMPDGVECMTMAEMATILDEDSPQETPASIADLAPEDPALIVFTSGTTGEPRAALHTASYLPAQRGQAEHWLGATKRDLVWVTTATGWSKSARNVFVAPWIMGAAALICDARFDAAERLAICEREEVSILCQAPTEYRMLASSGQLRPLPSLRRAISAGEPLGADMLATYQDAWGLDVSDGYGQTETGHVSGNHVGDEVRPGSMGRPLPGTDVRIAEGELQVRAESCATFFAGYVGAESPVDLIDGEWWATGDLVTEDEDGFLFHQGRSDDMITSSGYRIGPGEVESALLSHPAVAEAAAVEAPDPERGSVVRAVIVLREGQPSAELAAELREHVKSVTAPYKAPRIVDFADELPRTPSGKIRRAELRNPASVD
jgi:acyl-coenzyme A synthetase/AMP-(fatty) acid ligase